MSAGRRVPALFSPDFMPEGREFTSSASGTGALRPRRSGKARQGSNRLHDEHALSLLIQRIPVLPFTESDAQSFGVVRAQVRDRSRNAMDRLIAAHALNSGLTLVTSIEADFRDYPGLAVENWARAA